MWDLVGEAVKSSTEVALDPQIRDWVLLPIFAVLFLQGILRQYLSVVLKDDAAKPSPTAVRDFRANQQIRRSQRLRANHAFIPLDAFRLRRQYFVGTALREPEKKDESAPAPVCRSLLVLLIVVQDPTVMMGTMKQQMAGMVPHFALMGWVSFFFSGFVMVKLPFPLTERFKAMTQRGIVLQSLDVSYVSSLSWYFVLLFGMRGLNDLVLGDNNEAGDAAKLMQAQMAMPMAAAGPGAPDPTKMFATESNELEIIQHEHLVAESERIIVKT